MSKKPGHWMTGQDRDQVAHLAELIGMEGSKERATLVRDIHYLAQQWEFLAARLDYCTFRLLMMIGMSLIDTYLRGRGIRYAFRRSRPPIAQASLMTLVVKEVVKSRDEDFPHLRGLGVIDIESFGDRLAQSMTQRAADG